MLSQIDQLAFFTVARASGFAMLAIGTTMIGLSFDPRQCLQVGAVLSLLTALVLIGMASRALIRRYDATELWLLLDPRERPPQAIAQVIVGRALRTAYLRFASYFAHGALGLLLVNVAIAIVL